MNEAILKTRLLEAIEYIDDEYIESAARYKLKIKPLSDEPPVQTVGGSLKKYWKQYLGLVACLLLLSLASPIFNFVAQTINSIAGSMGSGTSEAVSDVIETEEYPFETDNQIFDETTEWYDAFADYTPVPLTEEKKRELEEASERLLGEKIRWYEESDDRFGTIYLGTFDSSYDKCVVIYTNYYTANSTVMKVYIAGYGISLSSSERIRVYLYGDFYDLKDAYYYGLISAEDVGKALSYSIRSR